MTRVLLPGRIRRHLVDVGAVTRYQGGTWFMLTRLCDRETKMAAVPFLRDHCTVAEEADLADPLVCPACLAVHQPAGDVDETMGTIPLFDLP